MLMLVDYHIHGVAHGEYEYSFEWIEQFVLNAHQKGITEIGLCEHDEFGDRINLDVITAVQSRHPEVKIRLGLEADYVPGQNDQIRKRVSAYHYDYIIGSVHFIDGWGFDHPDFRDRFDQYDIDEVYAAYFSLVERMIKSGWFDVVGHLDLVKIWGHRPRTGSVLTWLEPVLKAVKNSDMVVEINSAGLRKPVQEIYPSSEIIKAMFELNVPITIGSDAHLPGQVGEGFHQAVETITAAGYRSIIRFDGRKKYLTAI
ncbi:MAG: histidinol-phosphatase HisJ family protein [Syntrophomonadaceae bacterium]|jgi:histidinol-phosphatase (PHP family)